MPQILEKKPSTEISVIWIFNLRLDLNSTVLAAGHDWVGEFANHAANINVVSTHLGKVDLPGKVSYIELGGGNPFARVLAIIRLIRLLPALWRSRHESVVFHHMSPKTVLILGLPIRIMGIPQGLWYSHSKNSLQFQLSKTIVNYVFTSIKGAAPGRSKKFRFIGHGISESRFIRKTKKWEKKQGEILCVGRVSPVKKIEDLLEALLVVKNRKVKDGVSIKICGAFDPQSNYFKQLSDKANEVENQIEFVGPVTYTNIHMFFRNADFFFSGTPASVDKAVIEAAFSGCLILSENIAALELTGMHRAWTEVLKHSPSDLFTQLQTLTRLTPKQKDEMREIVWSTSLANNRISNTVQQIMLQLGSSVKQNQKMV
jgi:glycosyltransferase involved in cell wall biosynthesis